MPINDLSKVHELVSDLFYWPRSKSDWDKFKLTDEQVSFFNENGFLAGIKMLDDAQVNFLRNELAEVADTGHPAHSLYYEFHSNESADPSTI
jgi:hypothetical protein